MTRPRTTYRLVVVLLAAVAMMGPPMAWGARDGFRPIAPWTGRLALPSSDERQDDGSVWFFVENAPDASLVGTKVRLRWDAARPDAEWYDDLRTDVTIDEATMGSADEQGLVIPRRLDGWSRVSPLESLAGARPEDDVRVALPDGQLVDGDVVVGREPVQIEGTHRALVTFAGPAQGDRRTVVHFNPATGAFDGPRDEIVVAPTVPGNGSDGFPASSTTDIERSELNDEGWYADGRFVDEVFHVDALAPRRLFMVQADVVAQGEGAVKRYVDETAVSNPVVGTVRRTAYAPSDADTTDLDAYARSQWPVGSRALLVHLFGGRTPKDGRRGGLLGMLDIVTGHFAFGVATVVTCPFTGEARFDVEYRQVYAHNREGIVSGTHAWSAYMGSLRRGWAWTTIVVDTAVQVPEFEPFSAGGRPYRPLDAVLVSLAKMTAIYRTGNGRGLASVGTDVSCVQDSNCALYGALAAFERPEGVTSERLSRLGDLVKRLRRSITLHGVTSDDWKEFLTDPLGTRAPDDGRVAWLLQTIKQLKTVFPRRGNDNLLRFAAEYDFPMWSLRSVAVGGTIPNLQVLAPTSLLLH